MATLDNQKGWLYSENSTDCSLGFCTISCPQWCYDLFTPPSHFSLKSPTTPFSPLFISIIGVLATILLLFTYYTLITKLCGSLWFQTNNTHQHHNTFANYEEEEGENESEYNRHESWHLSSSNGLDEAFIKKITVCRYKRGEGLVEGTECSVCLSEFIENENLRLLPNCCHAFHVRCIDTWLKFHSNCPLCRVDIQPQNLDDAVIDIENLDVESEGNMGMEFEVIEMRKNRRGAARRGRSRGLHCVMRPIRMKRSVSRGRSWLVREGRRRRVRGKGLFLKGCGKGAKIYLV